VTDQHHFEGTTIEHLINEPMLLNVVIVWDGLTDASKFAHDHFGMMTKPELDHEGYSPEANFSMPVF
jgi:hypothetical protein